ncbi:MAG TPA: RNA ligase family protein [Catenuloplanes sp.]|jgi:predicted kinase
MRVHYPRTPHLPWSPGAAPDDVRAGDLSGLAGREVVVTEKLDGENTTMYADGLHARSLDSAHHPSRAWLKALHGRIAARIPTGWRVCGENLYARHSIPYQDLDSWFYAFSVWTGARCLDWDSTVRTTRRLGLPVPPVLWRGTFDERALRALRPDTTRQEGYVVRPADGFDLADFGHLVAKWVRRQHVRTDAHWMLAPVVPNGRAPRAALWDVRSGAAADVPALLSVIPEVPGPEVPGRGLAGAGVVGVETAVADVSARLDLLGRTGDARLAGVLATLLHRHSRASLAPRLVEPLGMPLARRVADLVGLHPALWRPFPDEQRRAGLLTLAVAVDPGVLHAVAAAALTGRPDAGAREQVDWSMLHADEAGLLAEAPLDPLRVGLGHAMARLEPDAADRCWAQARAAYAEGRVGTSAEASALTWRWRCGDFPRLVVMVGPSGSGKSRFATGLAGVDEIISLDDLRRARGSRADQRGNREVLRTGLERLKAALTGRRTVVWDATCLNRQQRSLVGGVAAGRDALVTHAVLLVEREVLVRRNAVRADPVPAAVLDGQLHRFGPPYPGEAHRAWYVGAGGVVEDVAGALDGAEP